MTDLLAAEAERLIGAHAAGHGNASLFLWFAPNAPHTPLQAPDAWLATVRPGLEPSVRTYAAMVGAMDAAFGRATSALRAARMLRHALVVFASDNGGPILPVVCNGGLRGGKGSPYDGGHRAPALLYWPACLGPSRRVSRAPAHMVDWFATLATAGALGLPPLERSRYLGRVKRAAPYSVSHSPNL
jgi:arylsulfatase A-like enzyme